MNYMLPVLKPSIGIIELLVLFSAATGFCQNLLNEWSMVGGGTGTSTAGVYVLSGTISQPNSTPAYSSDFKIDGIFWSITAAIQEPGAPTLSVRRTETNTVLVSWPIASTGFVLMETPELTTPSWVQVDTPPRIVVMNQKVVEKHVVVMNPVGNHFYRLRKQ